MHRDGEAVDDDGFAKMLEAHQWASDTEKLTASALGKILEIVQRYDSKPKGVNCSEQSIRQLIQIAIAVTLRLEKVSEGDPRGMRRIAWKRTNFPAVYSIFHGEWEKRLKIMEAIGLGEESGFQVDSKRGKGRKPQANPVRDLIRQNLRDINFIQVSHPRFELSKKVADLFPPKKLGLPGKLVDRVLELPPLSYESRETFASVIADMVIAKGETTAASTEIMRVRENATRRNAGKTRKRYLKEPGSIPRQKPSGAKAKTILANKILECLKTDLKPDRHKDGTR